MQNQDPHILALLFSHGAIITKDVKGYFEIENNPIPECIETFSHLQGFLLQARLDTLVDQQAALDYIHAHFENRDMLPQNLYQDLFTEW